MVEARAKEGSGLGEVEWRGKKMTVGPPAVGGFLLADRELVIEEAGGGQAEVDQLERHVIHCKDAMAAVRDLIVAEQVPPPHAPKSTLLFCINKPKQSEPNC